MHANPQLQPLAFLVGEWITQGTHPLAPGRTFHGRTRVEWLEAGAFLIARMHIDEPEIPDGVAIFGTDDDHPDAGRMLYFDVRSVSREYAWSISGNVWIWSRIEPAFSQRMRLVVADDHRTMVSTGEMSRGGASWEPDLQLAYTRVG